MVVKLLKELTVSSSDQNHLKKHGGLIQLVRFTRPDFDQEVRRIANEACSGLPFETPLDMHVWLASRQPPESLAAGDPGADEQLAIYLDSAIEGADRLVDDTEHLVFVQRLVQDEHDFGSLMKLLHLTVEPQVQYFSLLALINLAKHHRSGRVSRCNPVG